MPGPQGCNADEEPDGSSDRSGAERRRSVCEIVDALERVGAEVWVLDRPCDLAVWFRRAWYMLETKTRTGRFTALQLAEREAGKGEGIRTVRTPFQALRAISAISEMA